MRLSPKAIRLPDERSEELSRSESRKRPREGPKNFLKQ